MGSAVVVKLSERRKPSTDEPIAECVPLANGGIAIITELDGTECVWELDRGQAEIMIRALTLALVTRKKVRIVQPLCSAA
jgi:hypothetical protein